MAGVDTGAGEDVILDILKETDEAATDDVADVNKEGADDKAEIDQDNSNDEARKDALDAVIVEADAGKLGVDDDDDKDDEDDVGEVAHVLPDAVDGGAGVGGNGGDFELFADKTVERVYDDGYGIGDGTDDPREGASLLLADVDGFFGIFSIFGLGSVFGIFGASSIIRVFGVGGSLDGSVRIVGDGVSGLVICRVISGGFGRDSRNGSDRGERSREAMKK